MSERRARSSRSISARRTTPRWLAIFTFAPKVFSSLGLSDKGAIISANSVAFVGALVGLLIIERSGRRRLLLTSFWVMAVTIAVIGGWGSAPTVILLACFVGVAFFNAISGDLTGVYPAEIFPSDLRGSGVGFAAAMSRVGAAGGTFLLPIGIADLARRRNRHDPPLVRHSGSSVSGA